MLIPPITETKMQPASTPPIADSPSFRVIDGGLCGPKRFLGETIFFENEGDGIITAETEDEIYIESAFFTGWMAKAEYWEALGIEE